MKALALALALFLGSCATLDKASQWACGEELRLYDLWSLGIKPFRSLARQAQVETAHVNMRASCLSGMSVISIYGLYTNIKELMK